MTSTAHDPSSAMATRNPPPPMTNSHRSYLLLGEGDFTYSLDMCRYLASLPLDGAGKDEMSMSVSITCTGVDALEELHEKYKDIEFVLRGIRACGRANKEGRKSDGNDDRSNGHGSRAMLSSTTILHGINAVQAEEPGGARAAPPGPLSGSFDRVLFHHPHLGTEDAQLHARFLQHLFHAAARRWMAPRTGLLYLTLVGGQCARWQCLEGARRHGLVLLRRGAFCAPPPPPLPPPPTNDAPREEGAAGRRGGRTYYHLRRHQSGKSFANRRRMQGGEPSGGREGVPNESETLVFGRACDNTIARAADVDDPPIGLLPWEAATATNALVAANEGGAPPVPPACETPSTESGAKHPCRYCAKAFPQPRSWKNHMVCAHPDCEEVRAWTLEKERKKKNKKRKVPREHEGAAPPAAGRDGARRTPRAGPASACAATAAPAGDERPAEHGPPWVCHLCDASGQPARTFPHKQALLDHRLAKHLGAHADIKPDWCAGAGERHGGARSTTQCNAVAPSAAALPDVAPLALRAASCPVCALPYSSGFGPLRHAMEFVPSPAVADGLFSCGSTQEVLRATDGKRGATFQCEYCAKTFRDERARRQHENFCAPK